jgi:hypothetical protein
MKRMILAMLLAASAAYTVRAAELQAGTLTAWKEYLKQADLRMHDRAGNHVPFLWLDDSTERAARVRRGDVVIAPVTGHGAKAVPHGVIHDWIGAIFIPGATIDGVRAVVHDYDNYQHIYQPVVASSRTLACSDETQQFQMVWQRKVLFVSAAMQGRYEAHDVILGAHRGYTVAEAVEVREIAAYRRPEERLLQPDAGNGFIWRIRSMSRFEERDGGVYLELEALALTRDIPASVAWMVNPVVNHLSVNSLTTTLRQTRDAVIASRGSSATAASCPRPPAVPVGTKAGEE